MNETFQNCLYESGASCFLCDVQPPKWKTKKCSFWKKVNNGSFYVFHRVTATRYLMSAGQSVPSERVPNSPLKINIGFFPQVFTILVVLVFICNHE